MDVGIGSRRIIISSTCLLLFREIGRFSESLKERLLISEQRIPNTPYSALFFPATAVDKKAGPNDNPFLFQQSSSGHRRRDWYRV